MLQNPPKYNMNYISNFLAIRNASNGTSTPSPATPQQNNASIGRECDLNGTYLERINATTGKSFTIASILGLKKKNITNTNQSREVNAINLSLNQNYSMHKSAFSSIDPENRLLPKQIPLPFSPHHMPSPSHIQHHPLTHFNQQNNNNNNLHVTNHNQASALQSLQQQFHSKNSQSFSHFHNNKEQRNNKSEHSAKGKSSLKSKRVRTIFTPEQLERLEAQFERQQYMVGPERLYLADTLQLTEAQVKVWFQNRRIKWRKHHLEMTQQRLAIIRQNQIPPANTDEQMKINNAMSDKSTTSIMLASSPTLSDYESPGTADAETSGALDSELSICTDSINSSSVHEVEDL